MFESTILTKTCPRERGKEIFCRFSKNTTAESQSRHCKPSVILSRNFKTGEGETYWLYRTRRLMDRQMPLPAQSSEQE